MTEQYTFSSLHDFHFVELGKSILCGDTPRQCRLCGRWLLHEQGDRAMYCERIVPGEESKTCREAGAWAAADRDAAIKQIKLSVDAVMKAYIIN